MMNTSASHTPRLRLTRRGLAVITALIVIPLAAAALTVASNVASNAASNAAVASEHSASVAFEHVTVQAGETLWQLAEGIDPTADPRDVISDIVHLNQLAGADLYPGQLLAIPAQYSQQQH